MRRVYRVLVSSSGWPLSRSHSPLIAFLYEIFHSVTGRTCNRTWRFPTCFDTLPSYVSLTIYLPHAGTLLYTNRMDKYVTIGRHSYVISLQVCNICTCMYVCMANRRGDIPLGLDHDSRAATILLTQRYNRTVYACRSMYLCINKINIY